MDIVLDVIPQIEKNVHCLTTGRTLEVVHTERLCIGDGKHIIAILFKCGCCDGRLSDFLHEVHQETAMDDALLFNNNVLAKLFINFDCKMIGVLDIDGSPINPLLMRTIIVADDDRKALRHSRELGIRKLHLESSNVFRVDNFEDRRITEEEKENLLFLIMHGCSECGCHRGTGSELLLAKMGIVDMSAIEDKGLANKCYCDCICC